MLDGVDKISNAFSCPKYSIRLVYDLKPYPGYFAVFSEVPTDKIIQQESTVSLPSDSDAMQAIRDVLFIYSGQKVPASIILHKDTALEGDLSNFSGFCGQLF